MEKYSENENSFEPNDVFNHNIYAIEKGTNDAEMLFDLEKSNKLKINNIVESASIALNQLKQSGRAPNILAEAHGKIVALAYEQVKKSGKNSYNTISKMMDSIRKGIEKNRLKYDYFYEDVYEQFGPSRERGVFADVEYLVNSEKVNSGLKRKHYTNALLDNKYSIDYISTTLDINNFEIDLVQVKAGGKELDKRDIDNIIHKHQMFIERYNLVFEELKAKEVSENELDTFRNEFIVEEDKIRDSLLFYIDYYIDSGDIEAINDCMDQLESFKKMIVSSKTYSKGSNSAKYTYITNLFNILNLKNIFLSSELQNKFNSWKDSWVSDINVKKEKLFHEIDSIRYNIVIYNADTGEKDTYSIKNMVLDKNW